jgi:nitroreductase
MQTFDEVVTGRHSVRAFDPARPVPRELLSECLQLARHSPSNCNAQPWHVFIVEGERCNRLRQRLVAAVGSGRPRDENATPDFVGVQRARQIACAVELYARMGVERDDKLGRHGAELRNFEFFDAPQLAVLCMPEQFGVAVALDVGIYLQTFMLALQSRGISSCAQASLRCYASLVREELDIAQGLRILAGVSFGYPVLDAPVNGVRQARAELLENVTFVEAGD